MTIFFALTGTFTIGYVLFALIGMIGLGLGVYAALIEPYTLVYTRRRVVFPFERALRIAVVGDFHVGPFKGRKFVERVVKKTNKLDADLILLVGDFLFDGKASPQPLTPLKDLKCKYGVYAVLGNHENTHVLKHRRQHRQEVQETPLVKVLRAAGVITLHNETAIVTLDGGKQIALLGIDDLWSGLDDLPKALETLPDNMPSILLCHNPDVILDPESRQVHLIVSGHTHAGQVRIPWFGSVAPIPQQVGRKYDHGVFKLDEDTNLVITRGVGESGLPLRLFSHPEVMVLTTVVPGEARSMQKKNGKNRMEKM